MGGGNKSRIEEIIRLMRLLGEVSKSIGKHASNIAEEIRTSGKGASFVKEAIKYLDNDNGEKEKTEEDKLLATFLLEKIDPNVGAYIRSILAGRNLNGFRNRIGRYGS